MLWFLAKLIARSLVFLFMLIFCFLWFLIIDHKNGWKDLVDVASDWRDVGRP